MKQRNFGKAKGTFLQSLRMFVFAALILSGSSQAMEERAVCFALVPGVHPEQTGPPKKTTLQLATLSFTATSLPSNIIQCMRCLFPPKVAVLKCKAREEKHISDMQSALREVLQDETPGIERVTVTVLAFLVSCSLT